MTALVADTDTGELVSRSLADCEAVIERGLNTFVEVGAALMEIRDARLYRASHGDFDTYCAERWGMKRAHAYRLIESSEIVGALSPIGDTPTPETESQARALAPLKDDPDAMAEVMAEVAEEADKVTARAIGNKVAEKLNERLQAAHELRDQAAADVAEFEAMQPPDFDPVLNKELVRQRGELSRLCRDLVSIGDQTEFVTRHDGLRSDIRERAEEARDWLAGLCSTWENT